jgi:hypothetical protein
LRELQRDSDIGSALIGWLSQPTAHRHAFERQFDYPPSDPLTRLSRSPEHLTI